MSCLYKCPEFQMSWMAGSTVDDKLVVMDSLVDLQYTLMFQ